MLISTTSRMARRLQASGSLISAQRDMTSGVLRDKATKFLSQNSLLYNKQNLFVPQPSPPQKKRCCDCYGNRKSSLCCAVTLLQQSEKEHWPNPRGVPPYKGLMGTCGKPGYVFRDFCLKQSIEFIIFVLIRVSIYKFLS